MIKSVHPAAASTELPLFITAPGETDVLMVVTGLILLLFTLTVGILYLRIHHLPDHLAHRKAQYEIVCVLALIAMFTHMNVFWVAALLLALIEFPDFVTPLRRIVQSTETIANVGQIEGTEQQLPNAISAIDHTSSRQAEVQSSEKMRVM